MIMITVLIIDWLNYGCQLMMMIVLKLQWLSVINEKINEKIKKIQNNNNNN